MRVELLNPNQGKEDNFRFLVLPNYCVDKGPKKYGRENRTKKRMFTLKIKAFTYNRERNLEEEEGEGGV